MLNYFFLFIFYINIVPVVTNASRNCTSRSSSKVKFLITRSILITSFVESVRHDRSGCFILFIHTILFEGLLKMYIDMNRNNSGTEVSASFIFLFNLSLTGRQFTFILCPFRTFISETVFFYISCCRFRKWLNIILSFNVSYHLQLILS